METRNSRKRKANDARLAVPAPATRSRAAATRAPVKAKTVPGQEPPSSQDNPEGVKPHRHGSRRGAPKPPDIGTFESPLPTPSRALNVEAEEEVDEYEGAQKEDGDEGMGEGNAVEENDSFGPDAPRDSAENEEDDEVAEARREAMRLNLPDLSRAADKLVNQVRDPKRETALYRHMLKVQRKAFFAMRETYEQPEGYPFIDSHRYDDFGQYTAEGASIVGRANLASALDIVEGLEAGTIDERDIAARLAELDDFFHLLFKPFGDNANDIELSLNVRTLRLIETLAAQKPNAQLNPTLAAVFCEPFERRGKVDYPSLLINGPHRPLGHRDGDDVDEVREERIKEIISVARKDRHASVVAQLRTVFPRGKILGELASWVIAVYDSFSPHPSGGYDAGRQVGGAAPVTANDDDPFEDAREEQQATTQDDSESEVETQIVRPQNQDVPNMFSFESFRRLTMMSRQPAAAAASSSNQQQQQLESHGAAASARESSWSPPPAHGGGDDSDEDPFEQDQRPVAEGRVAARPQVRARDASWSPQRASGRDDDDDEEDPFEQDYRHVATENLPVRQYVRRPRAPVQTARRPIVPLSTIAHRRRPSRPTTNPPPSSSAPYRPSNLQLRHPWSAFDTDLLIKYVKKHDAAWSTIEQHNDEFERPRNQQALRDKARNLKVNYLLNDEVLPPGFNQVYLGRKEIQRVGSYGKNPFRREEDVDERGRVVHTEFQGAVI